LETLEDIGGHGVVVCERLHSDLFCSTDGMHCSYVTMSCAPANDIKYREFCAHQSDTLGRVHSPY
jgi:hypothetical protein